MRDGDRREPWLEKTGSSAERLPIATNRACHRQRRIGARRFKGIHRETNSVLLRWLRLMTQDRLRVTGWKKCRLGVYRQACLLAAA